MTWFLVQAARGYGLTPWAFPIHINPELPFTAFYGEREWFKPSGA